MAIIIKKKEDDYWLCEVSHTYINHTPYTNPSAIQDFMFYIELGKIIELGGLLIEEEYSELNANVDFDIVERISQVVHSNGLVYDDLVYRLKTPIL